MTDESIPILGAKEDIATQKMRAEIAKLQAETRYIDSPWYRVSQFFQRLSGVGVAMLAVYSLIQTSEIHQLRTQIAVAKEKEVESQLSAKQTELATVATRLDETSRLNAKLTEENSRAMAEPLTATSSLITFQNPLVTSLNSLTSMTSISSFSRSTTTITSVLGSPYTTYTTDDCNAIDGASPAEGELVACSIPSTSETTFEWKPGVLSWSAYENGAIHKCTCIKRPGAVGAFHSGASGASL